MVGDADTTTLTLNAGGLNKVVNIYALGMEDPNLPQDMADRQGFQALTAQLATFEQRGRDSQLGEVVDYDPAFYRVFLLDANGGVPAQPALDSRGTTCQSPTSRRPPTTHAQRPT